MNGKVSHIPSYNFMEHIYCQNELFVTLCVSDRSSVTADTKLITLHTMHFISEKLFSHVISLEIENIKKCYYWYNIFSSYPVLSAQKVIYKKTCTGFHKKFSYLTQLFNFQCRLPISNFITVHSVISKQSHLMRNWQNVHHTCASYTLTQPMGFLLPTTASLISPVPQRPFFPCAATHDTLLDPFLLQCQSPETEIYYTTTTSQHKTQ